MLLIIFAAVIQLLFLGICLKEIICNEKVKFNKYLYIQDKTYTCTRKNLTVRHKNFQVNMTPPQNGTLFIFKLKFTANSKDVGKYLCVK